MSLVTRCSRCKTLFRVLPAQLQARGGQVRCGRCMHVFDGFDALAVEQPNATSGSVSFAPTAAGIDVTPPVAEVAASLASVAASVASASVASAAVPAGGTVAAQAPVEATKELPPPPKPASAQPAAAPAPAPEAPAEPAVPLGQRLRTYWSSRVAGPLKARLAQETSLRTKWVRGCALLACLLVVQMVYVFRSDIAARYSGFRSVLTAICDVTGCAVTLPQRPGLVRIEASDVHMVDANRPSLIQVTATLRSYANYDLAYPALDLVLTNANEHALARRVFTPEQYLDASRDPKAGIPARGELTIALDLDTGNLNAAGFRLDLLAAPVPEGRP